MDGVPLCLSTQRQGSMIRSRLNACSHSTSCGATGEDTMSGSEWAVSALPLMLQTLDNIVLAAHVPCEYRSMHDYSLPLIHCPLLHLHPLLTHGSARSRQHLDKMWCSVFVQIEAAHRS